LLSSLAGRNKQGKEGGAVEQNDDVGDVARRFNAQRTSIERVRFAMPAGGMSTQDFSLITALCIPGGGGDDKMGTHLPDDTEIEVQVRTPGQESG
jgi:hypothetical protein